jgi:hypothetical protein
MPKFDGLRLFRESEGVAGLWICETFLNKIGLISQIVKQTYGLPWV